MVIYNLSRIPQYERCRYSNWEVEKSLCSRLEIQRK